MISAAKRKVLIVAIALTAVASVLVSGVFLHFKGRAQTQRSAVQRVHRLGGWAFYDSVYDDDGNLIGSWPRAPVWALRLFGVDFLSIVTGVVLGPGRAVEGLPDFGLVDHNIPVRDEHLEILQSFPYLEWLVLSETKITDRGLTHLTSLQRLRWLWLSGTAITDAGLAPLAQLPMLEKVWLDSTRIQGPGLCHLSSLKNLREISIQNTAVDDAGLACLAPLRQLQKVRLRGSRCSFRGIMEIFARLQNRSPLEALIVADLVRLDQAGKVIVADFSHLGILDDDLGVLQWLPDIQWLYLQGNPITDAGLVNLTWLPNLTLLDLSDTRITNAGVENLLELPNLETLHLGGVSVATETLKRASERKPRPVRIYLTSQL